MRSLVDRSISYRPGPHRHAAIEANKVYSEHKEQEKQGYLKTYKKEIKIDTSSEDRIKYFSKKGIRTNCTLVFSPGQALLAAKAGASYVSPFIGRLDDVSTDGLSLIEDIRIIYDNYGYETGNSGCIGSAPNAYY